MAQGMWQPDADVYSPDRSVHLCADQAGQVRVELRDLDRHDEDSLAGQVRAAVRVALATLQAEPGAAGRLKRQDDHGYGGWR